MKLVRRDMKGVEYTGTARLLVSKYFILRFTMNFFWKSISKSSHKIVATVENKSELRS